MIEKDYRFERKWIFNNFDKETLFQSLISSKLFFKPHFKERTVNSIYFDTLNLNSAIDNLNGISSREKFRVRWYGDNVQLIKNAKLERKVKKNTQGYKIIVKLDEFDDKQLNHQNLLHLTKKVNYLIPNINLVSVSMTTYKRIYLVSLNSYIRATIDYDVIYKNLLHHIENFFVKSNDIVLELKYASNLDSFFRGKIDNITRLSKNSKYVNSLLINNF